MRTKFLTAAAVLGALAATPMIPSLTSAHAEILQAALPTTSASAQEVQQQLDELKRAVYGQGYRLVVADQRGAIYRDGEPMTFRVHLRRGVEYRFGARCDSDCSDLDLVLRDANGYELKADRAVDDTPGFSFRPTVTGDYTVEIVLAVCSANRTQVGALVLARA